MSKYSDKTFEKILDDMYKRVIEVSTMEGSLIYTALALFAMELALLYMRLGLDEDNGYADTADYGHLHKKHCKCFLCASQGCHEFANEVIASQCKFGQENVCRIFYVSKR